MAIDIYKRKDTRNLRFQITDQLYNSIEDTIIAQFQKKTGVYIDNYGTTILTFQHARILKELLEVESKSAGNDVSKETEMLIAFLSDVYNNETDLDLIGD
ncbi:hypothetical protein DVR12_17770 [Chitinophaga silvatica]|uniref:Uncharacterized protein n=1 Tax=Chitinophaga silvatica TaxID=2282649 RepID=A0A3E1Y804_9BACT|nr:hypothetical protein [Chitinophaga silvatica]RFS21182.1 hypothetical protein DVR12_17770 [Chitinophaga silvatica]